MVNIDWKKETRGNVVYPEGTYKVRIESFERVEASTGTKQVRWKASIVEPEEHVGRSIVEHTPLTEKALWKIAKLVCGCGVDTSKLAKMETNSRVFDAVCGACIGRTAYWRVTVGTDKNGNPRNNIVEYAPDIDQEVAEVTTEEESIPEFAKSPLSGCSTPSDSSS